MFTRIVLRGQAGTLVRNYQTAARLGPYTVRRHRDTDRDPWQWELEATLAGPVDDFAVRQRPLLFTAPKRGGGNAGFFCFPVQRVYVHPRTVVAILGPPEY